MKIRKDGRVTIPKKLREKYGLTPHIEIEFVPEHNGICLQKKTRHKSPVRDVFGILKKDGRTDDYVEDIRGR
jgi:bifunctional DNA-binding transcriptional regulator/antitoxin component of YhaV-PrlF toxin-antitoxin module